MMNYTTRIFITVFCLLAMTLVACHKTPAKQTNTQPVDSFSQVIASDLSEPVNETVATKNEDEHKVKIGLLLPLTGKYAKLGKAMLDAAYLAALDIKAQNIIILPIDTGDNKFQNLKAVKKAVGKKVDIILGPVFSSATKAIIDEAKQHDINIISFSNNRNLLNQGVFLLGIMTEQQIERVVNYASEIGNIKEFSLFAPNNWFGKATNLALRNIAREKRLDIQIIDYYRPDWSSQQSARQSVRQTDLTKAIQIRSESTGAILLPEGGSTLKRITELMAANTLNKNEVRFLGSGQWNNPETLQIKGLRGSWFAAPPSHKRIEYFMEEFSKVYGYSPPYIASLAYDGYALVAYLAGLEDGDGNFSRKAITNPRGFNTLNGALRFHENGLCERSLSVFEVAKDQFIEIDPAPESF